MVKPNAKVLITGATGFLGRHLVNCIIKAGYLVWRLDQQIQGEYTIAADLTLNGSWQTQLRKLQPDAIFHLAGLTRNNDLNYLNRVHCDGTRNLIAALAGTSAWLVVASSGAVYGEGNQDSLPWREDSPCHPLGAYAESKYAQEQMAKREAADHGHLRLCIARIANLVGPDQSEDFFLGRTVAAIARLTQVDRAQKQILELGSLAATRDFIDVRDTSQALAMLLHKRAEGIFNVASGREVGLRDAVKICLQAFNAPISVYENPNAYISPISRQMLDISKITVSTGWCPSYCLHRTVTDMMAKTIAEGKLIINKNKSNGPLSHCNRLRL